MREFTARFASTTEIADWDSHVIANPNGGNLLQSAAFAETKRHFGWTPRYLVLEGPAASSYNLILEKSFPGLGRLWYLIKGPDAADLADVAPMLAALRRFITASGLKVFAVKIEPDIVDSPEARSALESAGLVKTFDLQPNDHTAILDVSVEENQLLRNLHSRGRNAVRRALREGVEVVRVELTDSTMRTMYELMRGTIEEKGTAQIRSFDYYRRFWTGFGSRCQGQLYFVYEDGRASVGAFVINYGHKGTYKDGGSLQKRSQYGDSHLVQWVAINELKAKGVTEYDFCGTPPADRLKDPAHPHHGLGMFKTSFTKTVTDFVGCWDLVTAPLRYRAWSVAGERVFRQLYTRRTGSQFY
ncbi:MAG: lipid II:glycine glycyltransferase FemX [Actinomycetales bacterium]